MATPPRKTLPVGYSRPVAWTFLAVGIFNLIGGLLILARGSGPIINLLLGVLFIVLGSLYFSRRYFTYTTHTRTVEVIAPIGTRRTFQAAGGDSFAVEGKKIVLVRADGGRKKLPVNRFLANAAEWDAVAAAIAQAPERA
ncbi:hypothetical protein [Spirillospora sp. NPDC029432]|uniref:hypothetical protein n=1 Tax=Spirillospora sp. NPDC029432 TaxID=3154599 RepID=UPI003453687A